jgi:hypothetical protein
MNSAKNTTDWEAYVEQYWLLTVLEDRAESAQPPPFLPPTSDVGPKAITDEK